MICRRANLFWTLSELYMTAVFAVDIYFKWVKVWKCVGEREGPVSMCTIWLMTT